MVMQYMEKCSLSAQEQAMQDLKGANKAELAASAPAGPSSTPSRARAQPQGMQETPPEWRPRGTLLDATRQMVMVIYWSYVS